MIHVVRHGRTASNAAGLLLGRLDPELDELGERQAAALAAALPRPGILVSSPLTRTMQTAGYFGVDIRPDDRALELDYGEWDGRPVADVTPEEWAAWRTDPTFAPPGGESLAEVGRRVRRLLDDIVEEAGDRADVVIVTHVSPLKSALAWALGVGDEVSWRAFVSPASITSIDVRRGSPTLVTFNDVGHLVGC